MKTVYTLYEQHLGFRLKKGIIYMDVVGFCLVISLNLDVRLLLSHLSNYRKEFSVIGNCKCMPYIDRVHMVFN